MRRWGPAAALPSAGPTFPQFAVENEHVTDGERADVPGPPVAAQEFDFQAIGREQLDDGAHVTRLNLRFARTVQHGHGAIFA